MKPSTTVVLAALLSAIALAARHHDKSQDERERAQRFVTSRASGVRLPLPDEQDAFAFVIYGDRTGGPAEGIQVLAQAVDETNLIHPDLVMTVGDLVQGYNERLPWLAQAAEFKGVMGRLKCPWFPVAGNHDIYWRNRDGSPPPAGEHESDFEAHFGPLWYAFRHKSAWFVALYSDEGDPATGEKDFDKPQCQRMSNEQLAWLEATLALARGADHVFVFLHHPRWLERYGDDWERVHRALAGAGNVKAVFGGHIHRMRYDGERDGIEYFTLATVGGVQDGYSAAGGYLHQYHLVTVRKTGIDVAAFPVGAAFDPRRITGAISEQIAAVAKALPARVEGVATLGADLSVAGAYTLALSNPAPRPIEIELVPTGADSRWVFEPDHAHVVLAPGERRELRWLAAREAAPASAAFGLPQLELRADYLAESWRVPLSPRSLALSIDARALPAPEPSAEERVLALDGQDDHARVDDAALALPDGPLTVECWFEAREFRERQGLVNKTESSEFGLFVDGGRPKFSLHVGGDYASASAERQLLAPLRPHHLAGVFDGREVRLYLDGELVARRERAGARKRNRLPLLIGADVGSDGDANSCFPGWIDEVRVSRVARYLEPFAPARRFDADGETVLLLHMDGALGPWLHDSSLQRAHARLCGAAEVAAER